MNLKTVMPLLLAILILLPSCKKDNIEVTEDFTPTLTGTWAKKHFWIDNQSIVFDGEFTFNQNNTFTMKGQVLDKKDTTYNDYNWSGEWAHSKTKDVLEFSYDGNFGIVGYYQESFIHKEIYEIELSGNELTLSTRVGAQDFKLVLIKKI